MCRPVQGQDAKTGYDGLAPPTVITAGLGGVNFNALRIALVDDEPANQRVAARFLKGLGVDPDNILILSDGACASLTAFRVQVVRAVDTTLCSRVGDDALELLKGTYFPIAAHHGSSPPHTPVTAPRPQLSFDVMFLDIRMPGKSGIDVMKEIAGPLPCPVIAMTGNVDKDSVNEYKYVRGAISLGFVFLLSRLICVVPIPGRHGSRDALGNRLKGN
jgi:CheY-like chemotaxis protein